MTAGIWIWGIAALAAIAFLGWYRNWRGPLSKDEIERYMATAIEMHGANEFNDFDIVRRFLEADDGREFVMLNLVRLAPGEVADPETGAPTRSGKLMQRYSRPFMQALIRRGGHPAMVARKVGGYVDAWRVPPDPGWTIVGFMRYRSRRDMIELVVDPRFSSSHAFKFAATAETFSFPTQPVLRLYPSPVLWAPLLLALIAALAHLAILLSAS
ncbi:hypothetical protein [Parvibaculum sp.]|uniref:hypothetical protein n=1 Tax=Parvibaculum sp. TaxID=2024848 RepID=UPI00391A9CAA